MVRELYIARVILRLGNDTWGWGLIRYSSNDSSGSLKVQRKEGDKNIFFEFFDKVMNDRRKFFN